jgi:tetratricopeptide (TPR) repeat protein
MRATEKRKSAASARKGRGHAAPAAPKLRPKPRLTPEQEKAYREFEHAVTLLYKQEYDRAKTGFQDILEKYPAERDLADRGRIYLKVCEGRAGRLPRGEAADPYLQAVVQYNEGEYEEALKILGRKADSKDARATYLTACAKLALGEREEGLRLLRESIRLDPDNRYRALNDPDLEEINTAEDFLDSLGDEERGA